MPVDVLSDVLRTVRLTGALFFPMDASSPWVDHVPDAREFASILLPGTQHVVSYHIVRKGRCRAAVAAGPPVELVAGDVLVVPHGDAYAMGSTSDLRSTAPMSDVLDFFRLMTSPDAPALVVEGGGGPERVQIVCGFLGCDVRPFNPVIAALPRMLHLHMGSDTGSDPVSDPRRRGGGGDRLNQLVDMAVAESGVELPGRRSVLLHLSELMFVEMIRRHLRTLGADRIGWLAALRDPVVGHALVLLHHRPGDPWSLGRLAKEVGVSRTVLAERFSALIGDPPMRYLMRWRIQLACRDLRDDGAKVSAVAFDVGYRSEAAFSRAFKALVGASPAAWRHNQRAGHAPVPSAATVTAASGSFGRRSSNRPSTLVR